MPVRVAEVVRRNVSVEERTFGLCEAIAAVSIRPQVGGEIVSVALADGQEVAEGAELFVIDKRPYEVALRQAKANHERDQVVARNAETEAARARALLDADLAVADAAVARDEVLARNAASEAARLAKLFEQRVDTQQSFDDARARSEAAAATLLASRAAREAVLARLKHDTTRSEAERTTAALKVSAAAVEKAELDLAYCTVRAPLAGRAGLVAVKKGNVVRANETILVTVLTVSPIYVSFAVPERIVPQVRRRLDAGGVAVRAFIPGDEADPPSGKVAFADNAIDRATGVLRLKASFANGDRRLLPGQYVDVAFTVDERPDALLVPASAVQTGQEGRFVFVLTAGGTVEMRPVTPGPAVGDETVIVAGLAAGEQVVTTGQIRLVPGAKAVVSQPKDAGR